MTAAFVMLRISMAQEDFLYVVTTMLFHKSYKLLLRLSGTKSLQADRCISSTELHDGARLEYKHNTDGTVLAYTCHMMCKFC